MINDTCLSLPTPQETFMNTQTTVHNAFIVFSAICTLPIDQTRYIVISRLVHVLCIYSLWVSNILITYVNVEMALKHAWQQLRTKQNNNRNQFGRDKPTFVVKEICLFHQLKLCLQLRTAPMIRSLRFQSWMNTITFTYLLNSTSETTHAMRDVSQVWSFWRLLIIIIISSSSSSSSSIIIIFFGSNILYKKVRI